jgi:hypothetical protein
MEFLAGETHGTRSPVSQGGGLRALAQGASACAPVPVLLHVGLDAEERCAATLWSGGERCYPILGSAFRRWLQAVVMHGGFDAAVRVIIMVSVVVQMVKTHDQSPQVRSLVVIIANIIIKTTVTITIIIATITTVAVDIIITLRIIKTSTQPPVALLG